MYPVPKALKFARNRSGKCYVFKLPFPCNRSVKTNTIPLTMLFSTLLHLSTKFINAYFTNKLFTTLFSIVNLLNFTLLVEIYYFLHLSNNFKIKI